MTSIIHRNDLAGWQVLALRPAGECRTLRRRIERLGGTLHCAAPWRIERVDEQADSLKRALDASLWLVTSPNAARCASGLVVLPRFSGTALAVGPGTRRALMRAGIARVAIPEGDFRSEGLLAMPALRTAREVVLVTGEGGRGLLDRELARRGVAVKRIEVYRRRPRHWTPVVLERLAATPRPCAVLVSSAEALGGGAALAEALAGFELVVSSERVAEAALRLGLPVARVAGSAAPEALVEALRLHAKPAPIR
ncbi:uroporphyrinogen-III synthase [Pseudomarimonas salicorniae]|uniref:Uroporphyrinogen-III synthase n=1 Tax=Pseudomarimonas salicorniae TaxID=2933270 RepID=A0ABT0GGC3_9GAMM|nr:uroporphyrinogen-III synthase [Lysobacter sp. CAU 1642]MCK7593587.1 uroporphyrinogen-III synthase [Lysobacter sp. CAU 1642]